MLRRHEWAAQHANVMRVTGEPRRPRTAWPTPRRCCRWTKWPRWPRTSHRFRRSRRCGRSPPLLAAQVQADGPEQLGPVVEDEHAVTQEHQLHDLCGALDVSAADLVAACLAVLRLVQDLADEQLGADRRDIVRVERSRIPLAGERLTVGQDQGELVRDGDPSGIVSCPSSSPAKAVLGPSRPPTRTRPDSTAIRRIVFSLLCGLLLDAVGAVGGPAPEWPPWPEDGVMPRATSGGWLPRARRTAPGEPPGSWEGPTLHGPAATGQRLTSCLQVAPMASNCGLGPHGLGAGIS